MESPRRRGRPANFDRDLALDRAMHIFWQHGYEATSMEDLTGAMNLSPSSLYAAFGDKRKLYVAAINRYVATVGSYPNSIFQNAPTARAAVEQLFQASATHLTRPHQPRGCMLNLALNQCSLDASDVQAIVRRWRKSTHAALKKLIHRDIAAGRLPKQTNAAEVASYISAVLQGMSVQARDGCSRQTLLRIGYHALRAWPGAKTK